MWPKIDSSIENQNLVQNLSKTILSFYDSYIIMSINYRSNNGNDHPENIHIESAVENNSLLSQTAKKDPHRDLFDQNEIFSIICIYEGTVYRNYDVIADSGLISEEIILIGVRLLKNGHGIFNY